MSPLDILKPSGIAIPTRQGYSSHVGDGAVRALGGVEWRRTSVELQVTQRSGYIGGTCYAVLAGISF